MDNLENNSIVNPSNDNNQREYIVKETSKNKTKRKIFDTVKNIFTYLFTGISLTAVIAIFVFVFSKGWKNLNWEYFSGDYQAVVRNFATPDDYTNDLTIEYEYSPSEGEYFSKYWGVSFVDSVGNGGVSQVVVSYIVPNSPFDTELYTQGAESGQFTPHIGWIVPGMTTITNDPNNLILNFSAQLEGSRPVEMTSNSMWFASCLDKSTQIIMGTISTSGDGFRGSFIATIYMILLTLAFALPLGIGGAIYLGVYAKKSKVTNFIRSAIDLLSGIPSIIFGLVGALLFIPLFSSSGKGSIMSGALTLAIMVLPIIVKNTEEAIKVVPNSLSQASLALGASQSQTIWKVILPNSLSGILTGTILAIGRIIGESASLIFAVGVMVQDNIDILQPATTLAVHIWSVMQGEVPNYDAACSISIVILIMILILNVILSIVSHYLNKFEIKQNKTSLGKLIDMIKKAIKSKKVKEVNDVR